MHAKQSQNKTYLIFCVLIAFLFISRKELLTGSVPANKFLLAGTPKKLKFQEISLMIIKKVFNCVF